MPIKHDEDSIQVKYDYDSIFKDKSSYLISIEIYYNYNRGVLKSKLLFADDCNHLVIITKPWDDNTINLLIENKKLTALVIIKDERN